jgi:hypothetical protein
MNPLNDQPDNNQDAVDKIALKEKRDAFLVKAKEYKQRKALQGDGGAKDSESVKSSLKQNFSATLSKTSIQPIAERSATSRPPQPPPLVHLLNLGQTIKPQPPSTRPDNTNESRTEEGDLPRLSPPPAFHTAVLQSSEEDLDRSTDIIDGEDIQLAFTATLKLDNVTKGDDKDAGDGDFLLDIIEWVYVDDNKEPAYFWNMITNETTYEQPEDFDGLVYSEEVLKAFQKQYIDIMGIEEGNKTLGNAILPNVSEMWQVGMTEDKETYYYYNMQTEETTYERPSGTLFISCIDENNNEYHWQECYDEEGNPYYYNMSSEESQWDLPSGTMYIIVSAQ